jgi:hypothetical protein
VIWVPVNESWGVPNLSNPRQQAHVKALYYLTKSLDNSRLVVDNDGWEHTELTDLFAIHDYTQTGEEFYRRFHNVGEAGLPLPQFGKMYLAPGSRYNGAPWRAFFEGAPYITAIVTMYPRKTTEWIRARDCYSWSQVYAVTGGN